MSFEPYHRICEPTLSVFRNGLIISYKKVGSRFLRTISSGSEHLVNFDNKQIDLIINRDNLFTECDEEISTHNKLKYKFVERYIHAPWHLHALGRPSLIDSFVNWKSDESFLNDMGVSSYTELFFENKKDLIFLVRDPLKRFFSGMTQAIIGYFHALKNHDRERNFFKKITGLSDEMVLEIIDVFIEAQFDSTEPAKKMSPELITLVFNFFLEHKWDLLISDIHTEPYLLHFGELIYNIVEESKFKILELDHLRSSKSEEFFSELRGDNVTKDVYQNLKNAYRSESNKPIYDVVMEQYLQNKLIHTSFDAQTSFVNEYLKNEYLIYSDLINSPNFINLQD